MTYEISFNKHCSHMFFVITRTDSINLCKFNGKGVFSSLERLSASINDNFHNHTSTIIADLDAEILDTFETIEEFTDLMCEYLI
jgi:site-specific DNA-adenine methylase